jgi:molecular chaperone GrpE
MISNEHQTTKALALYLREVNRLAEEKNVVNDELTNHENDNNEAEAVDTIFAETEESNDSGVESRDVDDNQIQELKDKNVELEKRLEEAENRYLRLQADFDNFRRRTKLDFEANAKYKSQNLITDLLPALDNFERALKMEADNEQSKSLLQGMEMVYRGLLDVLKKEGVESIETVGKEFDPHMHQAVMMIEDEDHASNVVIEEFQKGYLLKDRVIRPAMVKVSQ